MTFEQTSVVDTRASVDTSAQMNGSTSAASATLELNGARNTAYAAPCTRHSCMYFRHACACAESVVRNVVTVGMRSPSVDSEPKTSCEDSPNRTELENDDEDSYLDGNSSNLFVGDLSRSLSEDDLRAAFSVSGEVCIPRKRAT
jgi:hypothetical protein